MDNVETIDSRTRWRSHAAGSRAGASGSAAGHARQLKGRDDR
jgi:hypothetical protein